MSAPDPESRLVRDLQSDDPDRRRDALGQLYERYHRRVFGVAWRVLGDWNRAQDVTQDVFLLLARGIRTWRRESGLSSWIYRITVNRAIDAHRREQRRPAWRMGHIVPEGDVRRPRGDLPADVEGGLPPDRDALSARVQAALAALSPKLRAIAVLRYFEGLSYEELAQVLGRSMGTVKSRLNRAHAALARELGPWRPETDAEPFL